jgi:peptidoglycan/LPS O-acetylase OafA/YrhL
MAPLVECATTPSGNRSISLTLAQPFLNPFRALIRALPMNVAPEVSGTKPMGQANSRSSTYRPDIEGLRGIAVLLVVAFHCGVPGMTGGFVGVDVFFVLSGYLITGLLVAEIQKTSRLSLLNFYARRVRRLLPASALTLAVTLLIGAFIMAPQELAFAGRAARATALYMSNIFFAKNAANYFNPDVESNPLLHTWSLAVEEQFYLIWPMLIMLGLLFWRSRKSLLIVLSVLTLLSLAVSVWSTARTQTFAFYQLPSRAWEFGIGGLAALLPVGFLKLPSRVWLGFGWLGIGMILASGHYISSVSTFPGWVALVPVMGTIAALVAGAEQPRRGSGILLGSAPLLVLGTLSYSWYLWHWPFLVFAAALLPTVSFAGKVAACVAALVIAAVTHHFVENPIRFHPYLVKRPAVSLYLGAAITVFSVALGVVSIRFASRLADAPNMKAIKATFDDNPMSAAVRQRCMATVQSSSVQTCVFGDTASPTNIVLFGDSHAMQWVNPLTEIATANGWKLTTMLKAACPATDIVVKPPNTQPCASWRAEALRQIAALHPSLVVLGNSTIYLGQRGKPTSRFDVSLDEWQNGTRRTLEALSSAGLRVVAMRDNPFFPFDIPTCLARSIRHSWYPGGSCEISKSEGLNPAIFEAEKAGARGFPNVHFIDLTDRFCEGKVCPAIQGDLVIYRDSNHMTKSFAETLRPVLEAHLVPILKVAD